MEGYARGATAGPNSTNCTGPPGTVLRAVRPSDSMAALVVLLGLVTLLTALVNGAVILAICTTRKLHVPANYLICSLAVTDLLVALLVMPLSILYISTGAWTLGAAVCEAWLSLDMTCCTSSILHLCVIALDRYWAITKAVEYACRRSPRHAAAMVGAVWVISVFISVPPLFWRQRARGGGSPHHCAIEHDHLGYTIYSTFGAFYIPLMVILMLYYRIYNAAKMLYQKRGSSRHLSNRSVGSQNSMDQCRVSHAFCVSDSSRSDRAPGSDALTAAVRVPGSETDATDGQDDKNQIVSSRERKAARILGLILGAFTACWLPFFLKELLAGLRVLQPSRSVSDLLTWLGYVNSLINPLLYTSFNDDFKAAFKKLLRRKEHS